MLIMKDLLKKLILVTDGKLDFTNKKLMFYSSCTWWENPAKFFLNG